MKQFDEAHEEYRLVRMMIDDSSTRRRAMTRAMLTGLALIWLAAAPARATEAGADPQQRAEALVATARERVAAEEYAAAAAAYAEALELYPDWNIPEAEMEMGSGLTMKWGRVSFSWGKRVEWV
jgi:hypothetical protein